MNPRKLLALMGPRSPSLTRLMHREFGMRGNRSPVTPQDVAAALGWIKHPAAVQVYMLMWFPGYAERGAERVADHLGGLLLREWQRRSAPEYHALPGLPAFPAIPHKWAADPRAGCVTVTKAALFEMQHRQDCEACGGYGMVPKTGEGGAAKCEPCAGQGYVPYAKHLRARLVQIRRHVYIRHVDTPYSWLLATLRELEQVAAHAHYCALRDDTPESISR